MTTSEHYTERDGRQILDRILSSVEGMTSQEALDRRLQESILWLNAMAWHRQQQLLGVASAKDDYAYAKAASDEIEKSIRHLESLITIEGMVSTTRQRRLQVVAVRAIDTHTTQASVEPSDTSAK